MHDFYEKKAKDNEEMVACWCWVVAVVTIALVCVAVVKWIISLWKVLL